MTEENEQCGKCGLLFDTSCERYDDFESDAVICRDCLTHFLRKCYKNERNAP